MDNIAPAMLPVSDLDVRCLGGSHTAWTQSLGFKDWVGLLRDSLGRSGSVRPARGTRMLSNGARLGYKMWCYRDVWRGRRPEKLLARPACRGRDDASPARKLPRGRCEWKLRPPFNHAELQSRALGPGQANCRQGRLLAPFL